MRGNRKQMHLKKQYVSSAGENQPVWLGWSGLMDKSRRGWRENGCEQYGLVGYCSFPFLLYSYVPRCSLQYQTHTWQLLWNVLGGSLSEVLIALQICFFVIAVHGSNLCPLTKARNLKAPPAKFRIHINFQLNILHMISVYPLNSIAHTESNLSHVCNITDHTHRRKSLVPNGYVGGLTFIQRQRLSEVGH